MLCILCLEPPEQEINIFDENGLYLDISSIISKYFWLQPSRDNDNAQIICYSCWQALKSFHQFYKKVEEAHVKLTNVKLASNTDLKVEEPASDYSGVLLGIKEELCEDTKSGRVEVILEINKGPLEAIAKKETILHDPKSESESEIPLSLLLGSKKSPKKKRVRRYCIKDDEHLKKRKRVRSSKARDETSEISGEAVTWLPTCYTDEDETKRVSTETFDEVIKQNMHLTCEICSLPLDNFYILQEHYEAVHKERGYVACCGKKFDKRGALVDHILWHKYPEYFKCNSCPKVLSNRKNLKEHMKIHNKKLDYHCDQCTRAFHRKLLLDRHMDIHVSERTYKCDECDKLFASKFSLGQHKYGVHKGGYTKICDQCGKVTRDQEAFRRHQLEHTGEPKPYVECEKCGVKLANRQGLSRHIKSQHPEVQTEHECSVCGTVTSSIYALKRHITYMHKYERSHKCPMCDKAFKRALTLKKILEQLLQESLRKKRNQQIYSQ